MEVIITIFKEHLETMPEVKPQLAGLSLEVQEITTAVLYIPKEDTLAEFVCLLNQFKISFGAHASGDEIPEVIRYSGINKPSSI